MSEIPFVPPEDGTTKDWWDATRSCRFLLQQCADCAAFQHPPRPVCVTCACVELNLVEACGDGHIDTFTIVHRSPSPGFTVPYVVARVVLLEGPIVLTNIVGCEPADVRCDVPVRLAWRPVGDGRSLPVFEFVSGRS